MATLASKTLLPRVFLPFISLAFFWSLYNCWHYAIYIILFPGVILQLNLSFESTMDCAGLLQLGKSGLTNRGNLYTQYWYSLINVLGEEGDYCIEILLVFVWVQHYCSNCCGQLVTYDAVQVSNL